MPDTSQLPQRFPVDTELAEMDDPEFLEWCRRVRSAKETLPRDHVPEELQAEFERVNRAFMARAGTARRDAPPVNHDKPPATPPTNRLGTPVTSSPVHPTTEKLDQLTGAEVSKSLRLRATPRCAAGRGRQQEHDR